MNIARWLAGALVLSGTAACGSVEVTGTGGTGGTGGAGGAAATAAAACEEHSAAVCGKELECLVGREDVIGPLDLCTERMTLRCLSRVGLPGTGVTPEALSACAAAMSVPGCEMFTTVPAECQLAGARQIGEPCADGAQCQSRVCAATAGDGCGVCAQPDGSEDQACLGGCDAGPSSCSFEGTVCGYAEVCNGGLCYPGPEEGQECGAFPFYCTYPAACLDGACTLELPAVCPG